MPRRNSSCASCRTGAGARRRVVLRRSWHSPSACVPTRSRSNVRAKKSPLRRAFLFQLRFLVDDVLARLRIVFLDLDLVGRSALVLRRRVEVAGAGGRFQLDLFAHGSALSCRFGRFGLDLGQHSLDAELVDAPQAGRRDAQPHPAVLRLQPEAAVVQVGLEGADRLVVRVRHEMALHRLFAGDLADAGHCDAPKLRKARIIQAFYSNPRSAKLIAWWPATMK